MAGLGLNGVAVAHLRRHKGRSLLIVVGLAVAVAAFVGVTSLVLSLRASLDERLARYGASLTVLPPDPELSLQYGGVTVATAGSGEPALLDPSVLTRLRTIPSADRLAAIVPVAVGAVDIAGTEYLAIGTDIAASLTAKPWWQVVGSSPGSAPGARDEVLLGLNARNTLRSDPGASLTLWGREFTVAGVLQETGGEEDNAVILDHRALAEAVAAARDGAAAAVAADAGDRAGGGSSIGFNMIEIAVTDSGAAAQVLQEIEAAVPGVDVRSVRQSLEFNARAGSSLADIGVGATLLIVIVAALIVVLTMLSAVRERQKEIGVFRAVGFRRRHVVSLVFRETLLLSAVAAIAGILVGLLAAGFGPRLMKGLELGFTANAVVLAGGAALALVLGALAAIYPAIVAARLDPASALKRTC